MLYQLSYIGISLSIINYKLIIQPLPSAIAAKGGPYGALRAPIGES
jgi:hypothetical protein